MYRGIARFFTNIWKSSFDKKDSVHACSVISIYCQKVCQSAQPLVLALLSHDCVSPWTSAVTTSFFQQNQLMPRNRDCGVLCYILKTLSAYHTFLLLFYSHTFRTCFFTAACKQKSDPYLMVLSRTPFVCDIYIKKKAQVGILPTANYYSRTLFLPHRIRTEINLILFSIRQCEKLVFQSKISLFSNKHTFFFNVNFPATSLSVSVLFFTNFMVDFM